MKDTVRDALNRQVTAELHAAYLYLSMAAWFEARNLSGFAAWMRMQSKEEIAHAMKIFDFVNERGGQVELGAIDAPPSDYASPVDVFRKALGHEQKVTGMINDLYELALAEKDYPAQVMLQWFIEEQVEEEDTAGTIVDQLEMIGDHAGSLFVLDRQMASRGEHAH